MADPLDFSDLKAAAPAQPAQGGPLDFSDLKSDADPLDFSDLKSEAAPPMPSLLRTMMETGVKTVKGAFLGPKKILDTPIPGAAEINVKKSEAIGDLAEWMGSKGPLVANPLSMMGLVALDNLAQVPETVGMAGAMLAPEIAELHGVRNLAKQAARRAEADAVRRAQVALQVKQEMASTLAKAQEQQTQHAVLLKRYQDEISRSKIQLTLLDAAEASPQGAPQTPTPYLRPGAKHPQNRPIQRPFSVGEQVAGKLTPRVELENYIANLEAQANQLRIQNPLKDAQPKIAELQLQLDTTATSKQPLPQLEIGPPRKGPAEPAVDTPPISPVFKDGEQPEPFNSQEANTVRELLLSARAQGQTDLAQQFQQRLNEIYNRELRSHVAALQAAAEKKPDDVVGRSLEQVQRSKDPSAKGPPPIEELFGGPWYWRLWDRLRGEIDDRLLPVHRLISKQSKQTGNIVSPEGNAYITLRLYAGISGSIQNRLDKLAEIMRPAKGLADQLDDLMTAQRDIERDLREFKNPGQVTGQIAAEAIEALRRRMTPDDYKAIHGAADRIRQKIGLPLLEEAREAGLISAQDLANIKAKNKFWAPFDTIEAVADNEELVQFGSSTFQVSDQDVIRALQGTEKKIRSPLESLVNRIAKTRFLVERNKAMRSIASMATKDSPFILKLKPNQHVPHGYDAINYFDDGVRRQIAVPNVVADIIKGMNKKQANFITEGLGISADMLRHGATVWNIPFVLLSNAPRDVVTGMMTSGRGALFITDVVRAYADIIGESAAFKAWKEAGGEPGMLASIRNAGEAIKHVKGEGSIFQALRSDKPLEALRRQIASRGIATHTGKLVTSLISFIREFGSVVEQAPRVAAFKVGQQRGMGAREAALFSRDVTADPSRAGTSMQLVGRIVPFLNMRTQGTINVFRTIKRDPVKSAAIVLGGIMLPEVTAYLWNRQYHADAYDEIPEDEKENFLIVVKGTGWRLDERTQQMIPDYIKMPRADPGKIFGSPVRHFMDYLHQTNPMSIQRLALQFLSDMSPVEFASRGRLEPARPLAQTLPPIVRSAAQGASNYNFGTGLPIIPRNMQAATDKSLIYKYGQTPQLAMFVSRMLGHGVSPVMVDMFIKTNFGNFLPQLFEPGGIPRAFSSRVIGQRGGEAFNNMQELDRELTGQDTNARLRITHAMERHILGNGDEAQLAVDLDAAFQQGAGELVPHKTMKEILIKETERLGKSRSIDRKTLAILDQISTNHLLRAAAIEEGLLPDPRRK